MVLATELQFADRYAPCPCGSGTKAKFCGHLRSDGRFFKAPTPIGTLGERTGYSNPKCYAAALEDCCHEMTKEHYVSRSVLDRLGDGKVVISGFPWLNEGEERTVGAKGMSARMLCKRHNNALSPLDIEAGRFFDTITRFFREMKMGGPETTWGLFSGHDLERWLIKVFYGGMAAGVWSDIVVDPNWTPPLAGLAALFGRGPWSRRVGLYIPMHQPIFIEAWNKVSFNAFVNDDRVMQGVIVQFADVPFMCLDQPPTFKHAYRPPALLIRNGSDLRRLILSWEDGAAPTYLTLTVAEGGTQAG